MTSATQRRSSVALIALTVLVLSVDTANAVGRQATTSSPATVTRSHAHSEPIAHVSLVTVHARRAKHKAAHRQHQRPATAAPKQRAHVVAHHPVRAKRVHRVVKVTGPTGWP